MYKVKKETKLKKGDTNIIVESHGSFHPRVR